MKESIEGSVYYWDDHNHCKYIEIGDESLITWLQDALEQNIQGESGSPYSGESISYFGKYRITIERID